MQKLILILILMSPLYIFAQDAQTEALMKQLGYEKVDIAELAKKQAAKKPCSTCPIKRKKLSNQQANSVSVHKSTTAENELPKLRAQLPNLEQRIADLKASPNSDPSALNKHEEALAATKRQIKKYEAEIQAKKLEQAPTVID